ncbi:MAG TPA: CDF family Co(II)/Ni(II) efflux transporter DmeF [Xanthobacteraceae bacterium]|nr:CDF family Co(II)/Ni(II) efflux transporter DmeF [Xanthobacteraceae bacterium]
MAHSDADPHSHVFLGDSHERNERRTWMVIALCTVMMAAEIAGGLLFGSIALVADGLHMSTHASALLLAALAYNYARRHAGDSRFSFGTGKLGDLAGFTSAVILALISLLIAYEAVTRLIWPVPIHFSEAIPIAVLGLVVNVASVLLLSGGGRHDHGHGHGHGHSHGHDHRAHDQAHALSTAAGTVRLEIFEDGAPPRFRLSCADRELAAHEVVVETLRPEGVRQVFVMTACAGYLESSDEIPEPHAFTAFVDLGGERHDVTFAEHEHAHAAAHRDNNMRAAIVHVLADAAVSLMVIAGLVLGWLLGWAWMDPVVGLLGAVVIAVWAYTLIRDTGAILLDMTPDRAMAERMRAIIEADGDRLTDFHLWRLGPGHLGAILSVATQHPRSAEHYQSLLRRFRSLSHVTVQVEHQ